MSGSIYKPKVAAVVVAAGASKRMTAIKQLLPWKKSTLIEHVIDQLQASGAAHIFVVLGAYQNEIIPKINSKNTSIIYNENWSKGMGTSIAKMIPVLQAHVIDFDGLLIAACDQPLIPLEHYKKLIKSCINTERIIASSYGDGIGIPAVFDKVYFTELADLQKDVGAKSIIKDHLKHLISFDAPEGAIDLDTKERYDQNYKMYGQG